MTMNHYTAKFKRYSDAALIAALTDCHETLRIGAEFHSPAYIAKLWAEIDAIRDVQLSRRKGA
jgi:hypothetical protein